MSLVVPGSTRLLEPGTTGLIEPGAVVIVPLVGLYLSRSFQIPYFKKVP